MANMVARVSALGRKWLLVTLRANSIFRHLRPQSPMWVRCDCLYAFLRNDHQGTEYKKGRGESNCSCAWRCHSVLAKASIYYDDLTLSDPKWKECGESYSSTTCWHVTHRYSPHCCQNLFPCITFYGYKKYTYGLFPLLWSNYYK